MRKRALLSNNVIGKPIEEATYADICFYDKENDNKIIVSSEDFSADEFPLSRFTPIGIVAVPSSHTDDSRPRIVSLADMNCDTPDSGSVTSHESMSWGGYNYTVTDLPIKNQIPYLSNLSEDGSVIYSTNDSYLPSDAFSARYDNPLNSLEGFYSNYSNSMCSPYKEDGSKEERYFDTSNTGNVLSDFDGKWNTEKILAVDNSNSTDWQTASTINNIGNDKYTHPAFQCCWRFHTDGTKQGNWYLPSCRELSYMAVQTQEIERTFDKLNEEYNIEIACKFSMDRSRPNTDYYLSSTFHKYKENNNVLLRRFDLFNTALGVMSGNNENSRVRAFCEFNFL